MSDMITKARFFQHAVGDGRHLINNNFQVFPDGSFQFGDPSDICVMFHVQQLCKAFALPPVWELWSRCYPDDPMTEQDALHIILNAEPYTLPCDPSIPDDRADVLKDLRTVGCPELAAELGDLLEERGAIC